MGLVNLLSLWFGQDTSSLLAERIAGRSRMLVFQRVVQRLPELDLAEARGYIRARALAPVIAETDKLIAQEGAPAARIRERLIELALEQLVPALLAAREISRRDRPLAKRRAA